TGQTAGPGPNPNNAQQQQLFNQLGGTYAIVQVNCFYDTPNCNLAQGIQDTKSLLSRRISAAFNVPSALVQQNGPDALLIELPGVKNSDLLSTLLNPGAVAFLDTGRRQLVVGHPVVICTTSCQQSQYPDQYKAVLTGADVEPNSVSAELNRQNGQPVVSF